MLRFVVLHVYYCLDIFKAFTVGSSPFTDMPTVARIRLNRHIH